MPRAIREAPPQLYPGFDDEQEPGILDLDGGGVEEEEPDDVDIDYGGLQY